MRLNRETVRARQRPLPEDAPSAAEHMAMLGQDVENYPLHAAVWNGQVEMVRYLLELGVDQNRTNFWNETAQRCALASKKEYDYSSARCDNLDQCLTVLQEFERLELEGLHAAPDPN